MSLSSSLFLLFIFTTALIYYLTSKKCQWIVLLVASIIFYCSYSFTAVVYIIISSFSIYCATSAIGKYDKRPKLKKRIMQVALIFNFGILAFVKYTSFVMENIFGNNVHSKSIIIPLGISFYTFQIVGYLLDVYWKRVAPEKNYARVLLFTIYFPQIIQGPISRYKSLGEQFRNGTEYDFYNIKYGIQLIIWGFFKKIVIADTIATAANTVLHSPENYFGITVVAGLLAYSAELYCDFSGGIDVIRGTSQLFGIYLEDNFKRPFFSQSISEFWRRWHITLGTWMKDYVFYPMALSKQMNRLGKKCQKFLGRTVGRKIPMCLENIVVFLIVGIWHGASWHFIIYGLYNGIIIAVSLLLEPVYKKIYIVTHINPNSKLMIAVRIIRTFALVNLGWIFDDVSSLRDSITLFSNLFKKNTTYYDGITYLGLFKYQYMYVAFGLLLVLIVGIFQEKGIKMRAYIDSMPFLIKMGVWVALIFLIPLMGWDPSATTGFMYANF